MALARVLACVCALALSVSLPVPRKRDRSLRLRAEGEESGKTLLTPVPVKACTVYRTAKQLVSPACQTAKDAKGTCHVRSAAAARPAGRWSPHPPRLFSQRLFFFSRKSESRRPARARHPRLHLFCSAPRRLWSSASSTTRATLLRR